MSSFSDIWAAIVTNFSIIYFIVAAAIFVVGLLIWFAVRSKIHSQIARRMGFALLLALAFAPSIFGFDLGAVTVPAVVTMLMAMLGALRFIVFLWSVVSIIAVWSAIYCVWTLLSFVHCRVKNDAV